MVIRLTSNNRQLKSGKSVPKVDPQPERDPKDPKNKTPKSDRLELRGRLFILGEDTEPPNKRLPC